MKVFQRQEGNPRLSKNSPIECIRYHIHIFTSSIHWMHLRWTSSIARESTSKSTTAAMVDLPPQTHKFPLVACIVATVHSQYSNSRVPSIDRSLAREKYDGQNWISEWIIHTNSKASDPSAQSPS